MFVKDSFKSFNIYIYKDINSFILNCSRGSFVLNKSSNTYVARKFLL